MRLLQQGHYCFGLQQNILHIIILLGKRYGMYWSRVFLFLQSIEITFKLIESLTIDL